jgi:hypothetical protein
VDFVREAIESQSCLLSTEVNSKRITVRADVCSVTELYYALQSCIRRTITSAAAVPRLKVAVKYFGVISFCHNDLQDAERFPESKDGGRDII